MATKGYGSPGSGKSLRPGAENCAGRWERLLSSSRCCGDCEVFYHVRAELQDGA